MNQKIQRQLITLERVDAFGNKPEIVLTTKETPLFAAVATSLAALKGWGGEQESGKRGFREGSAERRGVAVSLRSKMRDIAEIAKSMKEEGDLGVAEKFRMPVRPTYATLMSVAQSFVDEAEPMKAAFIERGLPITFVDDLEALLPVFASASVVKHDGSSEQIAGTAGMAATAAAGMKAVRTLRPIMRLHLRDQPALLAAWNAAARVVQSAPAEVPEDPETPPSGGGSGSGILVAPGT